MAISREIEKAADLLANASSAVVSSGAGMSAESGIATFRDPGGVWDRLNPALVGTTEGLLNTLMTDPGRLIPFFLELLDAFDKAEPNAGHTALGELEKMGIVKTVITQNIDNLHQEGGSTDVVEVHGNGFRFSCLSCGATEQRGRKQAIAEARRKIGALSDYSLGSLMAVMPKCNACGGLMRPDVVMFGEAVKEIPRAFSAARSCDVMLAIGTSGVVYPAAYLPFDAKEAGARVIVINPNENAFHSVSDVHIPMTAAEGMSSLLSAVRAIVG